jgi:protoporphyrinogen oxidase
MVAKSAADRETETVVIGAGPAGLTAAYLLAKEGRGVTVLEADPLYVGGLSRTVEYRGYRFDIGGHRFFSKSDEIEALWTEILGPEMLARPRLSRIYYKQKFFSYPIRPFEALWKLGIRESALSVLSFFRARLAPIRDPRSFEDWVTNQFGKRLYRTFFKTYTEKVWGMSCREISADWAAQRIAGMSLGAALRNAVESAVPAGLRKEQIKTLVRSFRYPRLGPGMMWDRCAELIRDFGGRVLLGHRVTECEYSKETGRWTVRAFAADGGETTFCCDNVISSAPVRELAEMIRPPLPQAALDAARRLRYRDFLTIAVILRDTSPLPDNWIYVHDPSVKVGRIQNFKAWSADLVPDPSTACYGLEYFCFEGDGLWASTDQELAALATRELVSLGLARAADILDTCVVRQPKAYPVYDAGYDERVETLRGALETGWPGIHLVGRNGMHRYDNQDHAMMTAILTVKNMLAGETVYDVWDVNQDAEYHEVHRASSAGGLRGVPRRVADGTHR